jgi:hypothetical protein
VVARPGLFQVATGPLDLPTHARLSGLMYEIGYCQLPLGYTVACQSGRASKTLTNSSTLITGGSFIVYSAIKCSAVGLSQQLLDSYLMEQLTAGEQAVVENIFSTSANDSLGLQNPNTVNLGTAPDVISATAQLEAWLYARYGLPGVLHVPARAAAYFTNAYIVEKDNRGIWRTDMGTGVSFGNYAGTGPTGQAVVAGSQWIYITGQVAVWRTPDGELFSPPMGEVLNRQTNVITSLLEREYVVTYDCYAAAVLTALDSTAT